MGQPPLARKVSKGPARCLAGAEPVAGLDLQMTELCLRGMRARPRGWEDFLVGRNVWLNM